MSKRLTACPKWFMAAALVVAAAAPSWAGWYFTAGDRVAVGDASVLSFPSGVWTIEGWVKTPGASSVSRTILSWGSGDHSFRIAYAANNKVVVYYQGTSTSTTSVIEGGSPGDATDWVHLTVMRQSDNKMYVYIYENGTETTGDTANLQYQYGCNASENWYFGSSTFAGRLAEWAKYDRVLSSDERTARRAGTKPEDSDDGAPVWHFDMFDDFSCQIGGLTATSEGALHDHGSHPLDRGSLPPYAVAMQWPYEDCNAVHQTRVMWTKTPPDSEIAQTFTVKWDTANPPTATLASGVSVLYAESPVMTDGQTYYVRVDSVGSEGTTTGTVYAITAQDPEGPVYYVGDAATGNGSGSSLNNLMAFASVGTTESNATIRLINPTATTFWEYESLNSAPHAVWPDRKYQSRKVIEYGITREFQDWRPIGRFIDGSYCSEYPTIIVSYDPPRAIVSGKVHNGMMINPTAGGTGLDQKCELSGVWNATLDRGDELPLLVTGGARPYHVLNCESLAADDQIRTKVDSRYNMRNLSILTVVDKVPANNIWFRPSYRYHEGNAVRYQWSDVLLSRVPQVDIGGSGSVLTPGASKARSTSTQDFPSYERCVSRPSGELCPFWVNTHCHAWEASQCYAGYWTRAVGEVYMALHASDLGELATTKRRTLIGCIQRGIDFDGVVKQGHRTWWHNDGTTRNGRYWPIVFAGIVLDANDMRDVGFTTHQDVDDEWNLPDGFTWMDNGQFVQITDSNNYLGHGRSFFVTPPWEVVYQVKDGDTTMPYDITGTCNVRKGSAVVVAPEGETWSSSLVGRKFMPVYSEGGKTLCRDEVRGMSYTSRAYTVSSVQSATQLTLNALYEGEDHNDVSFRIAHGVMLGKQYEYSKAVDYSEFDPAEWVGRYWWINKPHMGPVANWPYGGLSMTGSAYGDDDYQTISTCSLLPMILSAVITHEHGGYPAVTAWNSPQTFGYYDWVIKNRAKGTWGYYESGWATTVAQTEWAYPASGYDPTPQTQPASTPSPAHGATGVAVTAVLGWRAGLYATAHKVYFGTDAEALSLVAGPQSGTAYDPDPDLAHSTTYYWRINELGEGEQEVTGSVWSFTTEDEPPPPRPKSILIRIGGQQ